MLKRFLIIISIFSLAGTVYAAPNYRVERTIIPELTDTYDLGTSTREWRNLYSGTSTSAVFVATSTTATSTFAGNVKVTNNLQVDGAFIGNLTIAIPSLTQGSVLFAGSGGVISQDNTNFYWNDTTNRLGISTTSPASPLAAVRSSAGTVLSLGAPATGANNTMIDFYAENAGVSPVYAKMGLGVNTASLGDETGYLSFSTIGSAVLSEKMRITGEGNVGIGTASPNKTLELNAATPILRINGTSGFRGIEYYHSGSHFASSTADAGPGEFRDSVGPAVSWGGFRTFYTDTVERLRITSTGFIGIGDSSPDATLDIVSATGDALILERSGLNAFGGNITGILSGTGAGDLVWDTRQADGGFAWRVNGGSTLAMSITEGGNIGIGTTTPSDFIGTCGTCTLFDISGVSNNASFKMHGGSAGNGEFSIAKNSNGVFIDSAGAATVSNDDIIFRTGRTASNFGVTEAMRIQASTGNIGVGTNDPSRRLHVTTAGTSGQLDYVLQLQKSMVSDSDGSAVGLLFQAEAVGNSHGKGGIAFERTGAWGVGTMHFLNDNSAGTAIPDLTDSKMVITSAGNVGIGTTTPASKLDVNGDIRISRSGVPAQYFTITPAVGGAETYFRNPGSQTGGYLFRNVADNSSLLSIADSGLVTMTNATTTQLTTTGSTYLAVSSGNVGIASTSPWKTLSVVGTMAVNGLSSGVGQSLCISSNNEIVKCGSANGDMTAKGVTIADTTISNTAASTTSFTLGTWSNRTFSANSLAAGNQVCMEGFGSYGTQVGIPNATVRMVLGTGTASSTLAQVTTSALPSGGSGLGFYFHGCATVRSTGASGTVKGNGFVDYETAVGTNKRELLRGTVQTVDTTVAQVCDVTVQWSAADSANTVTIEQAMCTLK